MTKSDKVSGVKKVSLYFVQARWKQVQAVSDKTGVPVSEIVRRVIEQWLERDGEVPAAEQRKKRK